MVFIELFLKIPFIVCRLLLLLKYLYIKIGYSMFYMQNSLPACFILQSVNA